MEEEEEQFMKIWTEQSTMPEEVQEEETAPDMCTRLLQDQKKSGMLFSSLEINPGEGEGCESNSASFGL